MEYQILKQRIKKNEKNNIIKKRLLEIINYCEISQIFNDNRACQINLESANEDIISELNNNIEYRRNLIDNIQNGENKIFTKENNEIFTISKLEFEETIQIIN